MRLMTQSQYARRKGVHRSRITQLVKEGRLSLVRGKIDPTVADGLWEKNIDPVKRDNLQGSKRGRRTKIESKKISGNGLSYIEVKKAHELLKTQLTELEFRIKKGELVPKGESLRWLSIMVIAAKMAFWSLPHRMAGILASETDSKQIESILRKDIRIILEQLAKPLPEDQRTESLKEEGPDPEFERHLSLRREEGLEK